MREALDWGRRLEDLGLAVQRHIAGVVGNPDPDLRSPVAHEGGDTIFAIDRHVEPIISHVIEGWPADCTPLLLIAEGFSSDGRRFFGSSRGTPRYRLIVDPIDGTRNIMYGQCSAWFLAAVAPDRGEGTMLSDAFAAVMVELPVSKQWWCDSFVSADGEPTVGRRTRPGGGDPRPLQVWPSTATDLELGFAQVSNFFPGPKVLTSSLMERIVTESLGCRPAGQASVFEDQYISTGGQMVD